MRNELNERFATDELGGVRVVSISAEAANARTVSLQFFSKNGDDMTDKCSVEGYLSSDSNGDAVEAASAGLTITAGTDGIVLARSAGNTLGNTSFLIVTEDDGDADVTITETTGANDFYLNIILPNGEVFTSAIITFAA